MSFDEVNEAADAFAGTWFKFVNIGDTFDVRLVSMTSRPQREYLTGEARVSRRGQIRTEWIVTGIGVADGAIYKTALREGAQRAVVKARAAAGGAKFANGGRLRVTYVSDTTPEGGQFAYQDFEASYEPPAPGGVDEGGPWNRDDADTGIGSVL